MCYIWHLVNRAIFPRARMKGNGMENFLLSHSWASLGVSHVLTCSQEAECVSSSHMPIGNFWRECYWHKGKENKVMFINLKELFYFLFFFFSWPFQVLTKNIIQSEAVFFFNAKYLGWKIHLVWNLGLMIKNIYLPWTMQSVPGNRTWADFRRE